MKKCLLLLAILASQNGYTAEIYKCVDQDGKQVYSDKKCTGSVVQEKIEYSETSLDEQLTVLAPGKSKIADISRKDGETLINYEFTSNAELTEFMQLSEKLSGKHVYLIKVEMPKEATVGKALIKITTTPGLPFSKPEPQN